MGTKEFDEKWDLAAMRAWSNLVFGSPHRLPVAVLASSAQRSELYAAQIADGIGTERKDAGRLLGDLQRAKVLIRAEAPPGPRPRGKQPAYMWRCDDAFWSCIEQLAERYRRGSP
jgi:hypothetical protein